MDNFDQLPIDPVCGRNGEKDSLCGGGKRIARGILAITTFKSPAGRWEFQKAVGFYRPRETSLAPSCPSISLGNFIQTRQALDGNNGD